MNVGMKARTYGWLGKILWLAGYREYLVYT